MKRYILLIIFLFGLFSCKSRKINAAPIPAATMEKILMDVHLAESYSTLFTDSIHTGKNKDTLAVLYKDLFQHYRITQDDFEKALEWYRLHPEEMDSLYTHIMPNLNKLDAVSQGRK